MDNFSNTTKLAIETCQQRRLRWVLRPRPGVSQPSRHFCKVVKIWLWARRELTGTLSPRFSELPDLQELNLQSTQVSGDIEALKNLRKLEKLNLVNTNVIGDMSAMRSTSLEDDFDIEGTEITCQDAALRAVLRSLGLQAEQLTDLKNFRGVKRMLSCEGVMTVFSCFFAHDLVD